MEAIAHLFKEKSFLLLLFLYLITTTIFFVSFHNLGFEFFKNNPVYIIIAYCSVLGFAFQTLSSLIVLILFSRNDENKEIPPSETTGMIVFGYAFFPLLLMAALWLCHCKMLPLHTFLQWTFSVLTIASILIFFIDVFKPDK